VESVTLSAKMKWNNGCNGHRHAVDVTLLRGQHTDEYSDLIPIASIYTSKYHHNFFSNLYISPTISLGGDRP
jgi:hypothetical protein